MNSFASLSDKPSIDSFSSRNTAISSLFTTKPSLNLFCFCFTIIKPAPHTIIRVFMEYKPLDNKIDIKEQELVSPNREGFTVVEWGGSLIK